MGSLYAITGLFGIGLIALAFFIFAVEGDKKSRLFLGGFVFAFLIAAVLLWFGVRAFLTNAS